MTLPNKNFFFNDVFYEKSCLCTSDIKRIVDWFNIGTTKKTTDDRSHNDDNRITRCSKEPKTSVEKPLERARILFITQLKPINYLI